MNNNLKLSNYSLDQPDQIDVGAFDPQMLVKALSSMIRIRSVERILASARQEGIVNGPVHLAVGQEAVATGVSAALRYTDQVFGAHRSHAHILGLGTDPRRLFAEVLGKKTGLSNGMGGSMHLWDASVGFCGSVPIVAGTVPIAVGAAMANRLQGSDGVSVSYLGDGACEEGVVHESLNLASINKEPVIFIVENNFYASHMHISQRQPLSSTARFASANSITPHIVDGNNFAAVYSATSKLVHAAREGDGPGFIEAFTYRWYGHVDWREDIDVGISRSKSEV